MIQELAGKWGMDAGCILGSSRERAGSKARREFLVRGLQEAGLSMAATARLCRMNHVLLQRAAAKAREGKFRGER